ncbi:hypothetical protein I3252_07080 [Psychrobacter sp. Ps4]|nr:hypothetical protein [Psychrobacter sp. Ps4]
MTSFQVAYSDGSVGEHFDERFDDSLNSWVDSLALPVSVPLHTASHSAVTHAQRPTLYFHNAHRLCTHYPDFHLWAYHPLRALHLHPNINQYADGGAAECLNL